MVLCWENQQDLHLEWENGEREVWEEGLTQGRV